MSVKKIPEPRFPDQIKTVSSSRAKKIHAARSLNYEQNQRAGGGESPGDSGSASSPPPPPSGPRVTVERIDEPPADGPTAEELWSSYELGHKVLSAFSRRCEQWTEKHPEHEPVPPLDPTAEDLLAAGNAWTTHELRYAPEKIPRPIRLAIQVGSFGLTVMEVGRRLWGMWWPSKKAPPEDAARARPSSPPPGKDGKAAAPSTT